MTGSKHGKYGKMKDGYTETWTAVSRPPYFTALALWKDHSGTWGGGGYFLDDRTVCQNSNETPHPNHRPPAWFRVNPETCKSNSLEYWQMIRNGWVDHTKIPEGRKRARWRWDYYPVLVPPSPLVYQRDSPDGAYTLTMEYSRYHFNKVYGDPRIHLYWVRHKQDNLEIALSDTWADWDQRGRLIYVEEGKLLVRQLEHQDMTPQLLMDFNPNRPESIKPPEWATIW